MANLFWSYDRVTSLLDFYGLRSRGQVSQEDLETRIHEQVSENIKRSWDQSRVFPYVQQYEFEGLLFSDVTVFGKLLDRPLDLVEKLRAVRSSFPTPEEINDNKETHPSKRIQDLMPSYQKTGRWSFSRRQHRIVYDSHRMPAVWKVDCAAGAAGETAASAVIQGDGLAPSKLQADQPSIRTGWWPPTCGGCMMRRRRSVRWKAR